MATTIVTLALDPANQERFDVLRKAHYPPHLNQIAAHLTLFHTLPDTNDIHNTLQTEAESLLPFEMQVTGVMSLGRGVAYSMESADLQVLHKRLSAAFWGFLSAQDIQPFRPHVVVQNKVSGEEAKLLRVRLLRDFAPWLVCAEGLDWWEYLGGPWKLRDRFTFRRRGAAVL